MVTLHWMLGGAVQRLDYDEVGLMVGLEVHQQLATERKLFCHCPAGRYCRTHDAEVLRHMRPTLSELGEYDGTALMEFKTRKNIVYLLHESNVCTYEMDDTPPFLVNSQAIDIAIEQCLMLGCDIVDEVHIARKQYLDGSIPTGFQRTAVVGVNGRLPFRGRELTVTQVTLEEDSCREVSDRGHLIVWRTDRLGMPLIETVTGPDLRTPEEVEAAILLIGRVCRSTGHVRVGLGASRQDINVSVRGGQRVEIKGVPKAGWAPPLVHGEAVRQVNLLQLRDELHRRGFTQADDVAMEHSDVTDLLARSSVEVLHRSRWERFVDDEGRRPGLEIGEGPFTIRAIRLPGLASTLSWPTQPGRTFAHELAGRVRVVACLDQQPILLTSERWPEAEGSIQELDRLRRRVGCRADDALVVVWGAESDTATAAEEIRIRIAEAIAGVPNETRQPFADGSTDFERILPGPDRMYPDTDSPPSPVPRDHVAWLRSTLPPPPWVREERYRAAGIPQETVWFLIRRGGADLVDRLVDAGADLKRAAVLVGEQLKGLRRSGLAVDTVPPERWVELFAAGARAPVLWQAITELVRAVVSTPEQPVEATIARLGLGRPPEGWEAMVGEIVRTTLPDHPDGSADQRQRFWVGAAMQQLRGKVPAEAVADVVSTEAKRREWA
jgi:glutamyl-tRNA(Gln) amidotransferase subunit E